MVAEIILGVLILGGAVLAALRYNERRKILRRFRPTPAATPATAGGAGAPPPHRERGGHRPAKAGPSTKKEGWWKVPAWIVGGFVLLIVVLTVVDWIKDDDEQAAEQQAGQQTAQPAPQVVEKETGHPDDTTFVVVAPAIGSDWSPMITVWEGYGSETSPTVPGEPYSMVYTCSKDPDNGRVTLELRGEPVSILCIVRFFWVRSLKSEPVELTVRFYW